MESLAACGSIKAGTASSSFCKGRGVLSVFVCFGRGGRDFRVQGLSKLG